MCVNNPNNSPLPHTPSNPNPLTGAGCIYAVSAVRRLYGYWTFYRYRYALVFIARF